MSTRATPECQSDDAASLEKSIRFYREMGFSDSRVAAQLILTGHPVAEVRARFPDVPASALPAPPVRQSSSRSALTGRQVLESAPSGATGAAALQSQSMGTAGSLIGGLLDRVAATRSQSPVAQAQLPGSGSELDGMSFQYVPFIQCSFPHGDPGEQAVFTRRNGWLEVTFSTDRPETGLPYGVPARLLTIYCTGEAIRTRSPRIDLGKSVHDFLRLLDIPVSRGERGSLRVYTNQILRLANCTLSIHENIRDGSGRQGLDIRRALLVDKARLWWDQDAGVGEGSWLELSSVLYQSLLERSAPLSTAAIRQLRKSPMDLDVYAWLVHRLFHLGKPSSLTYEQLSAQIGHSYGEIRAFRRFFTESLKRVLRVYPDARVTQSEKGILLLPSKPHIERRPGVRAE